MINEIRIDQPSSDADAYFELMGSPGAFLDNLTYLVIGDGSGGSSVVEAVVDLEGWSIGKDGFFLAAESTFTLGTADLTTNLNFENSDNVTHLLVRGFTGSDGDGLDTDEDGTLDLTPWSEIIGSVALIETPRSGDPVYSDTTVGSDGNFVPGHVYRCGDDWLIGSFDPVSSSDTPGAANSCGDSGGEVPVTSIPEIQGAGHISPLVGETVTTSGIVTAVDSNGFYLQDPVGDGDTATSDGLFVFTGDVPLVAVGDEAQVTGPVSEFVPGGAGTGNLSITQVSRPEVTVVSSGNALPDAVIIGSSGRTPPTENIDNDSEESGSLDYPYTVTEGLFEPEEDGIDFYEALEGMRVTVEDALSVSPTNRFGEIFTVANGGAFATGLSERGTLNISPDDFNPERIQLQFDSGILDFEVLVDVGVRLGDMTGVAGYNFGNFEVNVTESFTVLEASSLEPEISSLTGSEDRLLIASYNVLNLDPNDSDGDTDVADGQFEAVASDIVNNLNLPDIIALQEIQDNDGSENTDITAADETLALLAQEIEEESGVVYEFLDNPFIGDDTNGGQPGANIRVAFLYNPERVTFVEGSLEPVTGPEAQQTDPESPFFDSRPSLAATFLFNAQEVTVVNNHFSSKGGSVPLFGSLQPTVTCCPQVIGEGQEDTTINGSLDERRDQAEAVKAFVQNLFAEDADAHVVALGDFNEFEFISPLDRILGDVLVNLTLSLPEDERYTFIFQGNSQSLDHILVSPELADDAHFDAVHINSEFVDASSDHDPLLVSLLLPFDVDAAFANLIAKVEEFREEGALNRGQAGALTKKLEGAERALERGNTRAALGLLVAFENQVRAFGRAGTLTDAQADALLQQSQALLNALTQNR